MTNEKLHAAASAKDKVEKLQEQYDVIVGSGAEAHLVIRGLTPEEKGMFRILGAALVAKHLDVAKKEYAAL